MWPRLVIDLTWADWAYGVRCCLAPPPLDWGRQTDVLPCLSVRSAFDLLLRMLAFAPGDEVLMCAITIPDMAEIVGRHGLKVVPLDIHSRTLSPDPKELERRITPRTRMLVVTHLFGARCDIEPLAEAASRHGLFLVEDSAQAFAAPGDLGAPQADASFISLGPIKTATALGGGLVRLRHPKLLDRMRAAQERYPLQPTSQYARRIAKYGILKILSHPILYAAFFRLCSVLGHDPDQLTRSLARNFSGADLVPSIRRQASAALLSVMWRRWRRCDPKRLKRRARLGRLLAEAVRSEVELPGDGCEDHAYWVFPVLSSDPPGLVADLRKHGFDATQVCSLRVIGGSAEETPQALRLLRHAVFLPLYADLREYDVMRMADRVLLHQRRSGPLDPIPLLPKDSVVASTR